MAARGWVPNDRARSEVQLGLAALEVAGVAMHAGPAHPHAEPVASPYTPLPVDDAEVPCTPVAPSPRRPAPLVLRPSTPASALPRPSPTTPYPVPVCWP